MSFSMKAEVVTVSGIDLMRAERPVAGGLASTTFPPLLERTGVLVAFSERTGGASASPYGSLDLAAHVGDDPALVDANRRAWLDSLGMGDLSPRLVTAEQVHGDTVAEVAEADAGSGASAAGGRSRIAATDALLTSAENVPVMLLFADCVPVVLVAPGPVRTVCVAHAGWRGAAAGIAGKAARSTFARAGCGSSEVLAFIGPHIGPCHYEVGPEVLSHFEDGFATMRAARGHLDLGAVVAADLRRAGVLPELIWSMDACTAEMTDRFYSYRAEGKTGRHAALAVLTAPNP